MPRKAPSCDEGHDADHERPSPAGSAPVVEVLAVCIGPSRALSTPWGEVPSGIRKQAVVGPVALSLRGLEGDEQADPTLHGGLSRAVYAYPAEHLPLWQTLRAQARVAGWHDAVPPGTFGENLLVRGVLEADAWIGDVWRFPGGCELAVSEPRMPCHKLDAAMGFRHASKMMLQSGTCGVLLAVRVPGVITAGDGAQVVPGPREVSIAELFRARRPARPA